MAIRKYYTCKNCDFSYMHKNYLFYLRNDMDIIEKYENLLTPMKYSEESEINGNVIQRYCKNCDKTVSIYQTGFGLTIFPKYTTIELLKTYIPKKQENLLKTTVLLYNLVNLVKSNASLTELTDYLKEHDEDFYYKIDFMDYLSENSFESMDFDIKNYIKEPKIEEFNKKYSHKIYSKDLFNDAHHSSDLDLKSLYKDMTNHLNEISAKDLNRKDFYRDISRKFDWISKDLIEIKNEIPCINFYGDNFNIKLDGEKIDTIVCPQCGMKFYILSPDNPCPKCGKNEINLEIYNLD